MTSTSKVIDSSSTSDTMESLSPKTPDRGRPRSRYPSYLNREVDSEGKPRPLLHRRGTSRTYETLEDLLKEAGYKETRVFTPEMERREERRDEQQAKARDEAGGVGGAVVKLFSSWMSTKRPDIERAMKPHPQSPLAHRAKSHSNVSSLRVPPSPQRSSSSSTLTVRPSNSDSIYRHPSLGALQYQHSLTRQSSTRPALTSSTTSASSLHPHSRARIALRHATSAPQIDKRRARTQPRASRANKPKVPPLPVTWLESLSAALRSPPLHGMPSPPPSIPRKPSFITQRAHTSPVAVTITNVVCRSAPSSRSPSAVRPTKSTTQVLVPSLAQTCVSEELASTQWPPHSPHHLPRDAPAPVDDDEDEELNLTMMLIPSKRQHSICSLRSVLLHHNTLPSSSSMAAARDEYARIMRRRIDEIENEPQAGTAAGADGEGHWDSGEFLTARVKRRRSNLPRSWGWTSQH